MNPRLDISNFILFSITSISEQDSTIDEVQRDVGIRLSGKAYRMSIGSLLRSVRLPNDHKRRRAPVERKIEFVVGENGVVHKDGAVWTQLTGIQFA